MVVEVDGVLYAARAGHKDDVLYKTDTVAPADSFNWDQIPVETGATADPAAGAQLANIVVPAGKRWLFIGGYGSIVTDGTGANRYLYMTVKHDGTNTTVRFAHATAMTASLTWILSLSPAALNSVDDGAMTAV